VLQVLFPVSFSPGAGAKSYTGDPGSLRHVSGESRSSCAILFASVGNAMQFAPHEFFNTPPSPLVARLLGLSPLDNFEND
jgi:hypothetical protein